MYFGLVSAVTMELLLAIGGLSIKKTLYYPNTILGDMYEIIFNRFSILFSSTFRLAEFFPTNSKLGRGGQIIKRDN